MDDKTAQLLLELLTLGNQELDPEQAAAVERTLCASGDLEPHVRQDRDLDALLGPAMRDVPVPPDLKQRIHTRLASQRGGVRRKHRLKVAGGALAVLFAVGVFWGVRWSLKPELNADAIAAHYDPQVQDPIGQAEHWLAGRGLTFAPALPLDVTLLTAFEAVEFQGETVPVLVFTNFREQVTARVYVARSRQFDLDAVSTEARQSFCAVQIVPDQLRPDRVSYVVVYTGHSIQPFLRRDVPVAVQG